MVDDATKEFMARREAERKRRYHANILMKNRLNAGELSPQRRHERALKAAASRRANREGKPSED